MKTQVPTDRRGRMPLVASLVAVVLLGIAVVPHAATAAATPPTLKLGHGDRGFIRVNWRFADSGRQRDRTLEIARSVDGGSFVTVVHKPRPGRTGLWRDKTKPTGRLQYRARLVLSGRAETWGPVAALDVTPPSTTSTTVKPSTTTTSTTATTTTTTTTPGSHGPFPCPQSLKDEMLAIWRAYRQARGLSAVTFDSRLATAAQSSAAYNGQRGIEGQDPLLSHDRDEANLRAAGWPYDEQWAGMNLAQWINSSAQGLFDFWLGSPGHRAHIQDPNHRAAGMGCVIIRMPWAGGTWDYYFWALAGGW
jgi:uncharacterized protein YkwD